MAPDFFEFSIS